jgi:hypothetical protein
VFADVPPSSSKASMDLRQAALFHRRGGGLGEDGARMLVPQHKRTQPQTRAAYRHQNAAPIPPWATFSPGRPQCQVAATVSKANRGPV